MIRNFINRFRPRYIRSLVYMAQASEYQARDFLAWYHRISRFSDVEKRRNLKFTLKAIVLLGFGWTLVIFWLALAGLIAVSLSGPWNFFTFFVFILAMPFFVAYGLAGLLSVGYFVQWPIEQILIYKAKKKLSAHKAIKIAIAGSYGKTSMREILKTVLGAGKRVAAPPGSYNTPLGIARFVKGLKGNEEILIFELGEYYPGDVKKLCELIRPDIGVITGVNEAHLEKFKDLSVTQKTIFELADYLGGEKPLYINGENRAAENLNSSRRTVETISIIYSRAGTAMWTVERAQTGLQGTSFTLKNREGEISAHSNLIGLHNIGPLAAAADIANRLGSSLEQIERGLDKTKPFEHRLEPKTDAHGVTILDDSYNGNPDGVRAVIEFLASLEGMRRWYVTPGLVEMGPKKEQVHKEIGRQLANAKIEKIILIKNSVTPFIEKGLKEAGFGGELLWFEDGPKAFAALPNLTVKGDIVLIQNDWPDQYA